MWPSSRTWDLPWSGLVFRVPPMPEYEYVTFITQHVCDHHHVRETCHGLDLFFVCRLCLNTHTSHLSRSMYVTIITYVRPVMALTCFSCAAYAWIRISHIYHATFMYHVSCTWCLSFVMYVRSHVKKNLEFSLHMHTKTKKYSFQHVGTQIWCFNARWRGPRRRINT